MRKLKYLLILALALTSVRGLAQGEWRDNKKPVDERVELLMKEMTLDEKIVYFSSDIPENERLGIPKYMWYGEALHGLIAWGEVTSFPQNNAMGSTWNRELMLEVANAISDEARAYSNTKHDRCGAMMYSPTVNMSRDPRWGRNEECYSEDPYHMSEMARMFIRGMQGTDPNYLKTVCTVKHYAANNVEHQREIISSNMSERDLREYYFPAYKSCIVDERAAGIMTALNSLNGVPCSGNDWLINQVLRGEWGFDGYVVADWGAVGGMHKLVKYVPSYEAATALALKSGCDQECFRPNASQMVKAVKGAIEQGLITEEDVDRSLRRLLRLRFLVNGFDCDNELDPFSQIDMSMTGTEANRELALKAAEESIVLLKNEKNILPLSKNTKSIAVVGPFADQCWLGIYSGRPKKTVSPLQGIKNAFAGEVNYAQGCNVTDKDDTADMSEAISAAKKSDIVIAFVGNDNQTSTENTDRSTLHLPGRQEQLLDEICKVNKNVIVVIVPSGSTVLGSAQKSAKGIICGWANGQEQGTAIANVLFGDVNPSGKLNTTWFAADSDLPDLHDYNIRNNRTYMYFKGKPLYPYGYGLSYTKFKYSDLKVEKTPLQDCDSLTVTVNVTNTGKVAGDEVAQLYIKNNITKEVEYAKALKGFDKVSLKAGETKTITFKIAYDSFSYWNTDKEKFVVDGGKYEILVGASSQDIRLKGEAVVKGGDISEHSLRTVSYENYNKGRKFALKGTAKKVINNNVDKSDSNKWVEYSISFVDPGFYVSSWDVVVNYSSAKANSKIKVSYDGIEVGEYILNKAGDNVSQNISIPKPDYEKAIKVRFTMMEQSTTIKDISVVWAKDNSKKVYNKPSATSK